MANEDVLMITDKVDFLRREDVTTYLSYKKPIVQESKHTQEENFLIATGSIDMPIDTKKTAFMQSLRLHGFFNYHSCK